MRVITIGALWTAALLATAPTIASRVAPYKFAYDYPPQVRAIPALKAVLDSDATKMRKALATDALTDRRDSARDHRAFIPYAASLKWKIVTDIGRFLSLSAEGYSYNGGAHGMSDYDSLIWDRAGHRRLASLDFFTSRAALRTALRPAFCDRLDRERTRRRGAKVVRDSGNEFDTCVDPTGNTIVLGSSNHQRFDRIGVICAPYEAGSYAEGTYEVTVPVTSAIIASVDPRFRRYFAPGPR